MRFEVVRQTSNVFLTKLSAKLLVLIYFHGVKFSMKKIKCVIRKSFSVCPNTFEHTIFPKFFIRNNPLRLKKFILQTIFNFHMKLQNNFLKAFKDFYDFL